MTDEERQAIRDATHVKLYVRLGPLRSGMRLHDLPIQWQRPPGWLKAANDCLHLIAFFVDDADECYEACVDENLAETYLSQDWTVDDIAAVFASALAGQINDRVNSGRPNGF